MSVTERRPGILMVTGAYLPEISGGGLQCRDMIRELGSKFVFRVLTTFTDPSLPLEQTIEGVEVKRVYVDVNRPSTKISAAWAMIEFVLRHRRDFAIAHLHGFSQKSALLVMLCRALRKQVVITIHTAGQDDPEGVRKMGSLAYSCYKRADRFIAISGAMADRAREAGLSERLRVVPNGVDTNRFRPATADERNAACERLDLDPALRWIAFVGFFSREKAPRLLFEAWQRLPEAQRRQTGLVFAGATQSRYREVDAAIAAQIRAEASRLNVSERVRFTGELADVEQVYRAADIYVMPSTREAFGMSLVEAMATGLPVVATRISGVTDAIVSEGSTGVLFPSGDAAALAKALELLLSDPAAARIMGIRARTSIVETFAAAASASRLRGVYEELLRERR